MGLLSSCALDDAGATDPAAADPASDVDEGSSESVCTQGVYRCSAHIRTDRTGRFTAQAAGPTGFGPPDLQSAYKIDPSNTVGKPVVGIAIAYGYAALETDLATYRSQYGLPACTVANGCLKIVNQRGQASPLPPEPPPNDDWRIEQALDVDMVSAGCPRCNILVVQADDNTGDGLFIAQNVAAQLGATVISNSWGGPEDPQASPTEIARLEAFFQHPSVAIFAAAGDHGYNDLLMPGGSGLPGYPATSANVISVGGTRLVRDAGARGWAETAWSSGGSACSTWIAKPSHQNTSPCKFKAGADIAAVGDPVTGVAVYYGLKGWMQIGGTSASAPLVAAIFAATGNGAVGSGSFLAASTSKLFDVTTGTNGTCAPDTLLCTAAVGWDGPSGYGTPNAKALAPPVAPTPGTGSNGNPTDPQDVSGGCSTSGSGAGLLLAVALLGLRRASCEAPRRRAVRRRAARRARRSAHRRSPARPRAPAR